MNDHDIWYLSAVTTIGGELRGYSRQIKARPPRNGETVPAQVQTIGQEFLAGVVAQSDVLAYSSVLAGERADFPYRYCQYDLRRNGVTVARSISVRPIRPDVLL